MKIKPHKARREVNASLEEPSSWKLSLYSEYIPDSEYLRAGAVIWLHHSEKNSTLAAHRKDKGVNKYEFSTLNLDAFMNKNNLEVKIDSLDLN